MRSARPALLRVCAAGTFVFAVAIATADEFDKPSLGVSFRNLTEADFKILGPKAPKRGVIIIDCDKQSSAYKAGLRNLDIVTHLNGKPAGDIDQMIKATETLEVGKPATVVARRPVETRGRIQFDKGTLKLKPITRREFLKSAIIGKPAPGGEGTIYRHHAEPENFPEASYLELQLFENGGEFAPGLMVTVVGESWLFANKIVFDVPGKKVEEERSSHLWKHHNTADHTWEWSSFSCEPESRIAPVVNAMFDYSLQKVYLHGDNFVKEIGAENYEATRAQLVAYFYEMQTGKKIK